MGSTVQEAVGQPQGEGHLPAGGQGELEGDVPEQPPQGPGEGQAAGPSSKQPRGVPVLRGEDRLDTESAAQRAVHSMV